MDSAKVFGDAEECQSSSESGWTMYIGSPTHSDAAADDEDSTDHEGDKNSSHENRVKAEEDPGYDSMASDASSGPSTHRGHYSHTKCDQELDKIEDGKKKIKARKQADEKKIGGGKGKQEKEEDVLTAKNRGSVATPSSDKVRKGGWFGKSK